MSKSNGLAYAMVVAMENAILTRQSRSGREQAERDMVLTKRMLAEGHKVDTMIYVYGSTNMKSEDGKLLLAGRRADLQRASLTHTTKGDFSHLHANPLICK